MSDFIQGKSGIRLVHHDPRFLVVHKDPGLAFHTTEKENQRDAGVLQIVRQLEARGDIPAGERLFPVHRLDRITSGILLFARGRKYANQLGNAFRHNRVDKVYIALSDRRPKKKQGTVSGDMIRGRGGQWILTRAKRNPAQTRFMSVELSGIRPGMRMYVLKPRTGRTHQLRVALKSLGSPVLGDSLYGRYDMARKEDRAYLHAAAIRFDLDGKSYQYYDAPAPGNLFAHPDFVRALQSLGDLMALKI